MKGSHLSCEDLRRERAIVSVPFFDAMSLKTPMKIDSSLPSGSISIKLKKR